MVAFQCPWRLSDGRFFQVDAAFLNEEVVQKGEDVLREHGFEGAHDEFREAREELSDGQPKDAILKAFKSFESTLKTVLEKHNGNVSELLEFFRGAGFMDDIPEAQAKAVCKQVLASLAPSGANCPATGRAKLSWTCRGPTPRLPSILPAFR